MALPSDASSVAEVRALPPTANWYTCYSTAASHQFFVYATNSLLVVMERDSLKYVRTIDAAQAKINAIDIIDRFCIAGGNDPVLRVLNLLDGALLTSLHGHKTEVRALKFLPKTADDVLVISGDKSGLLILQHVFLKKRCELTPVKSEITSLAVTERQDETFVAVGYQNGMILVFSVDRAAMQLKEHCQFSQPNDMVNALAWSVPGVGSLSAASAAPAGGRGSTLSDDLDAYEEATMAPWPLLASSGRRTKAVVVWSLATREEKHTVRLPAAPAHVTDAQRAKVWIDVLWQRDKKGTDVLMVSTHMGHICAFAIQGNHVREIVVKGARDTHTRSVFNLCPLNTYDRYISTGHDKMIISWCAQQPQVAIKTHSGFIHSIAISALNPTQAAVGLGDGNIKLWQQLATAKRGKKRVNPYASVVLWRGLQGQIVRVHWHPQIEETLAYATEYGHVGLYDLRKSTPVLFSKHHAASSSNNASAPAVSLAWLPPLIPYLLPSECQSLDSSQWAQETILVSCGADHVYFRTPSNPRNPPIDALDVLRSINPKWHTQTESRAMIPTCVASLADNYLAIGYSDGFVEVYSFHGLRIHYASICQRNTITCMDWKTHKDGTALLATGCQDGSIIIHKIDPPAQRVSGKNTEKENETALPVAQTSAFCELRQHKGKVTDVKWSMHVDQWLLASSSVDGLILVWDVCDDTLHHLAACFDRHRQRALCVQWHHLEPDIVLSGAEDRFLYMWNWKGHKVASKDEIDKLVQKRDLGRRRLEQQKKRTDHVDGRGNGASPSPAKKQKMRASAPLFEHVATTLDAKCNEGDALALQQHCFTTAARLAGHDPTDAIDATLATAPEIDDIISHYSLLPSEDAPMPAGLAPLVVGGKNDVRKLIKMEVEHMQQQDMTGAKAAVMQPDTYTDEQLLLHVMQSDYSALATHFSNSGMAMMDWVALALSPAAGKEAWLAMMEDQAAKLRACEKFHLAASCYLACSKVYDAIAVYRQAGMPREALAVAKMRLPNDQELNAQLLSEWATTLQSQGQEELAALCHIQAQLPGWQAQAASLMGRRDAESACFWAACIARLQDQTPLRDTCDGRWHQLVKQRVNAP
ncbi:WD40-repeat-containing domain protein [Gongronella butleri]|nr:WD40-repeat-containing domain protein [Gongronella butleri]